MTSVNTPAATASVRRRRGAPRTLAWAAFMLAPALVSLVILRVIPTVEAVRSSFYEAFPGGLIPATFAGFANYETLLGDREFLATVTRTVLFNLVINPLQIIAALAIAVLLTRKIAAAGLWRTFLFVPITIPIVGSSIAWGAALDPNGPVNAIIAALGGSKQGFFTSPEQALASILVVASWIGIGYWMLFLIAGIQAIPEDLYEAARLDRAGPVRLFFSITLPSLRRPLLFVLVANTVANFVLFVPVQLLTGGGPEGSTMLMMFHAYRTTYSYGSRNVGAAEIVILTAIMLIFVFLQFRLLKEDRDA